MANGSGLGVTAAPAGSRYPVPTLRYRRRSVLCNTSKHLAGEGKCKPAEYAEFS